jgi:predicted 3-demethylubiquinone-9 3-methyltransferase (glyoxalase superfamily)
MAKTLAKIQTNLWFDDQAEDAVCFYTSIFKNSKKGRISYYTDAGKEFHGKPAGSVMSIEFTLEDQNYTALNGGPVFKLNEAVSIIVNCENQTEADYYWEKLSEGSDENTHRCGWLVDKYGLSWQIIPVEFYELTQDPVNGKKVMQAMFGMKKLDIAKLRQACN